MDNDTARTLERIETKQCDMLTDIVEIKNDIRNWKNNFLSLEGHEALVERVKRLENSTTDKERLDKIEANLSKAVWIVLSVVISAVLGLVIIG